MSLCQGCRGPLPLTTPDMVAKTERGKKEDFYFQGVYVKCAYCTNEGHYCQNACPKRDGWARGSKWHCGCRQRESQEAINTAHLLPTPRAKEVAQDLLVEVTSLSVQACHHFSLPVDVKVRFFGSLAYELFVEDESDIDIAIVSSNENVLAMRCEILHFILEKSDIFSKKEKVRAYYASDKKTMYATHRNIKVDITLRSGDDACFVATDLLHKQLATASTKVGYFQWCSFVRRLFPNKEIPKASALFLALGSKTETLEGIIRFTLSFAQDKQTLCIDNGGASLIKKSSYDYISIVYGPDKISTARRISPISWAILQQASCKALQCPPPPDMNPEEWTFRGQNRFLVNEECLHVQCKTFAEQGIPIIAFGGAGNTLFGPPRDLQPLISVFICVNHSLSWTSSIATFQEHLKSLFLWCVSLYGPPLVVGLSRGSWNSVEICSQLDDIPVRGLVLMSGYFPKTANSTAILQNLQNKPYISSSLCVASEADANTLIEGDEDYEGMMRNMQRINMPTITERFPSHGELCGTLWKEYMGATIKGLPYKKLSSTQEATIQTLKAFTVPAQVQVPLRNRKTWYGSKPKEVDVPLKTDISHSTHGFFMPARSINKLAGECGSGKSTIYVPSLQHFLGLVHSTTLIVSLQHTNQACKNLYDRLKSPYVGIWSGDYKDWPNTSHQLIFSTYSSFAILCCQYENLLDMVSLLVYDEPHVNDSEMFWLFGYTFDYMKEHPDCAMRVAFCGGTLECNFMNSLPVPCGQINLPGKNASTTVCRKFESAVPHTLQAQISSMAQEHWRYCQNKGWKMNLVIWLPGEREISLVRAEILKVLPRWVVVEDLCQGTLDKWRVIERMKSGTKDGCTLTTMLDDAVTYPFTGGINSNLMKREILDLDLPDPLTDESLTLMPADANTNNQRKGRLERVFPDTEYYEVDISLLKGASIETALQEAEYSLDSAVRLTLRNRLLGITHKPYLMQEALWQEAGRRAEMLNLVCANGQISNMGYEVSKTGMSTQTSMLQVLGSKLQNDWVSAVAAAIVSAQKSVASNLGKGIYCPHPSACHTRLQDEEPSYLRASDISIWVWRFHKWLHSPDRDDYAAKVGADKWVLKKVEQSLYQRVWWLTPPVQLNKKNFYLLDLALLKAYPFSVCLKRGAKHVRLGDKEEFELTTKSLCNGTSAPLVYVKTQKKTIVMAHCVSEKQLILANSLNLDSGEDFSTLIDTYMEEEELWSDGCASE